ncbi:MAG: hydroxyacid dehydrogenase [Armatimonadetes bacterium]|nr:hydroxyacid dehydrogenase [Armatimonadota bacterium]
MKVLVADKLEQSALDGLSDLGYEVVSNPDLKERALADALKETQAEILIVRSTRVPENVMDGSNLSLIIRAGSGYNTIDVEAASTRGTYVANCPGKNSIAVAELAFGLMLALDRFIPDNVAELRAGKWNKKRFGKGKGLYGRTLGIIGLGNVAQELIVRAQAFGMNVVGFSRFLTPESAVGLNIGRAESLEELAQQSDIVSVHVALRSETTRMIDKRFFDAMKDGAYFINTSRAEVVVQDDLIAAVNSGKIVAGLDVIEGEPTTGEASYDGEIKDIPGIYCTHHIGASTAQAQGAVADEVVQIVKEFVSSGGVPNVVNVTRGEIATHLLVVRHLDKVGVLAHVFDVLRDDSVNVQEMENVILGKAKAAIAHVSLDKAPSEQALVTIRTHSDIFDASVLPISTN